MKDAERDELQCQCPERDKGLHEHRGCALTDPDWTGQCEVCDASPIVPCTGLCGPCTIGEAEKFLDVVCECLHGLLYDAFRQRGKGS